MSNNKHSAITTAFTINLFILLVCILGGGKFYLGLADDYFMARILEGAYGDSYNVHMVFVNVLYGYVLLPFYYLFPKIGWYYIGEIFAVFISFTVVSYVAIKKLSLQWGAIFSILLIACFARDFYLTVQFTQCAAALGAAGMVLFVYALDNGLSHKKIIFFAFILVIWGYCMRGEAFLMGLPFFVWIMVFFSKKAFICKYQFCLCMAVIICGLCGAKILNDNHYSTPEYQKHLSIQPHRVMLGDRENYDKEAVYDEVEEDGLHGEDYSLLLKWIFYDPEAFSLDSLKCVTDKIQKYTQPLKWSVLPSKTLYRFDCSIVHPCCWAFCLVCLVLLWRRGKRSLYVWGSFAIMFTMMSYLIYLMRLVYRVEAGLWFYATALAIPLLKGFNPIPRRVFYSILISFFIAYASFLYFTGSFQRSASRGNLQKIPNQEIATANYKILFKYMDSLPDNTVFLVPMTVYGAIIHYREPLYYTEPIGCMKRMIPVGFWHPYFPDVENSLRQFGIENPMRDAIKENVVVLGYDEFLQDYLHRHYYENINVDTLNNIGGVKFFKYSEGLLDAEH